MKEYYNQLIPTLSERAQSGIMSAFGFSNVPLRKHLNTMFDQPYGEEGSIIGEPSFEAVFGWKSDPKTFDELRGNLLEEELVDVLIKGDLEGHYHPYTHQIEAWKVLGSADPKSAIISSGTGSGKTECFMIPILNRLIKKRKQEKKQIEGVHALFLYPLNALINSQRERLQTWTSNFEGDIRFCLYNGLTPEKKKKDIKQDSLNEVLDRETLRETPPPILVTNPTMLEYMLVRAKDNPILQKSKGKLDTIVLDEAHTYIGSQAAEITLLLRRVLHAFGKKPEEVRFVATSATIKGGDDAENKLREFLAKIAGVPESNVSVITGSREIPKLAKNGSDNSSLTNLQSVENEKELYKKLENHYVASRIRSKFVQHDSQALSLNEVCSILFGDSNSSIKGKQTFSKEQQVQALKWLDLMSFAVNKGKDAFLPIRAHIFERTIPGLWACADENCSKKNNTALDSKEWPFGMVYIDNRTTCLCGGPVFEIISCKECGEVYLDAERDQNKIIQPSKDVDFDEFSLELEDEEASSNNSEGEFFGRGSGILILNRNFEKADQIFVNKETREITEDSNNAIRVTLKESASASYFGCPNCMDRDNYNQSPFRTHAIGAPSQLSVLLPTLLNFAGDPDEDPNLPYKGRRLLSFNDSRQGTARISAKLQQEAERVKARGLIYHHILQEGATFDKNEIKSLEDEIKLLEQASSAALKKLILNKKSQLIKLTSFQSVAYTKLISLLSSESGDFKRILKSYAKVAPELFGSNSSSVLAELMIFREFARRPRKQNNLETLGLVFIEYKSLQMISSVPYLWSDYGLSLKDWHSYLGICCDYFIRSGGSLIAKEDNLRHWLGLPFYRTYLVDQQEEDFTKDQRRWPNVRRGKVRSRIVRYLIKITGADPENKEDVDKLDEILRDAWAELTSKTNLLSRTDSGYILGIENLTFVIPDEVWICPITRRFIDKTVNGITPYIPSLTADVPKCEKVQIPRYDMPFGQSQDPIKNIERAQSWINKNEVIKKLRESGHWSLFNDKVIEQSPYYRTAEHSAQQDSNLLKEYEEEFKKGQINILACSTTMEMGIDIGGIKMVSMNNLPPNPANYLQRAGRAGRRKETRSTTVTLCKPNPHDLSAFYNSKWAFETKLPSPAVSLHSELIVQRHVNSFLLASYLNDFLGMKESEKHKLTTGWFYGTEEVNVGSPYTKYINWLMQLEISDTLSIKESLTSLVVGSSYQTVDPVHMLKQSSEMLKYLAEKWNVEFQLLGSQRDEILENESQNSVAAKAVEHQIKRLSGEYLLRELAAHGFLPGYGFPSGIAVFDNYNFSKFKRAQDLKGTRDDLVFNYRSLPSRDIVTALREYAPGAEIVQDGVVYKSSGITLNWHVPVDQRDIRESQALKFAWRCDKCGSSDTTYSKSQTLHCHQCNEPIKGSNIEKFIEPSGFATDFYEPIHNDVTTQQFIPVENPWIQSGGDWKPLANPELGRYRSSSKGNLYHHSKGINGTGYGICMMCGRAEPMDVDGALPKNLAPGKIHKKLKGAKKERNCPGSNNEWAIIKNLSLGSQSYTDVFELQLKSDKGEWLNCKDTAATIAVVLRDSFAELMGIESVELICDVQEKLTNDSRLVQSIFIYDRNASGFMSNTEHLMSAVFVHAQNQLKCKKNCNANCPSCVLDYDQRFRSEQLDRTKGLVFLNNEWLQSNQLPEELAYLGSTSELENRDFIQALIDESNKRPQATILLIGGSDDEDVDFATSEIRQLASLLGNNGKRVKLALSSSLVSSLSGDNVISLLSLIDHENISLKTYKVAPRINDSFVLSGIDHPDKPIIWVSNKGNRLNLNDDWGGNPEIDGLVIKGIKPIDIDLQDVDLTKLKSRLVSVSDLQVEIWKDLDGPVKTFGDRLWEYLFDAQPKLSELLNNSKSKKIVEVEYSDRYLYNPISVVLIVQLLSRLKKMKSMPESLENCTFLTTPKKVPSYGPEYLIFHDWHDSNRRNDVLKLLLEKIGYSSPNIIDQGQFINHDRYLKVKFEDKSEIVIRFDQGMGYWKASSDTVHRSQNEHNFGRFEGDVEDEANHLLDKNFYVVGGRAPSPVFVTIR